MVKVSIIMPAYNSEKYIERAIDSVITQSLSDIELIIVNDGSKDKTLSKIEGKSKKDGRIIIENVENNGVSRARNIGLEKAKGEFVMFLDADDSLESNSIELLYKLANEKDADMVVFEYNTVINEKKYKSKFFKEGICISGKEAIKQVLLGDIVAAVWNKFIRKSVLASISLNEEIHMGEDLLYSIEVCNNCSRILLLDNELYCYYVNPESVTNKVDDRVYSIRKSIKLIRLYLEKENLDKEYKEELEFLEFMHLYFYRVVVGNSNNDIHKDFYYNYNNKNIKNNSYYKIFVKKARIDVKLRLYLYEMNYKISRIIHNFINQFFKGR